MPIINGKFIPRGLYNNNPGNIRKSPTKWLGEIDGTDDAFETFQSPELGIRAIVRILLTYQRRHGLDTIEEMIGRWAPPIENDTTSYVDAVARSSGVSKNKVINLYDNDLLLRIVKAIIVHENGYNPYEDWVVEEGIRLGLV
jgi:hypothetical protein